MPVKINVVNNVPLYFRSVTLLEEQKSGGKQNGTSWKITLQEIPSPESGEKLA